MRDESAAICRPTEYRMQSRIEVYLTIVPAPVLAIIVIAAVVLLVATPRAWLLPIAVFLLPIWLDLARMPGLGIAQAVAKVSSIMSFVLILFAVLFWRGFKRRISPLAWIYPLWGLLGIPFIITVEDRNLAVVLQFQWMALSVGAIALATTISSERQLRAVIGWFALGTAVALFLPLSALFLDRTARYMGRFWPWDANPNQIGVLFILATPLSIYLAVTAKNLFTRLFFTVIAFGGAFMGLLTASRSVVFPLLMLSGVSALPVLKRPSILIVSIIIFFGIGGYAAIQFEATNLDRLQTLHTGRTTEFGNYLRNEILRRPITGLMGTSGMDLREGEEQASHAHNAYLESMYKYGVVFGAVPVIMAIVTISATFRIFRSRRRSFHDTYLITMLCAFQGVIYLHGFVNSSSFYPTYHWAFFNIFLSTLMLSMASDLKRGHPPFPDTGQEDLAYGEYGYSYDPYDEYDHDYARSNDTDGHEHYHERTEQR